MTLHYHGTPITPLNVYSFIGGRHYCVSFAHPSDVQRAHDFGQSVMLDNGAFSVWKRGYQANWDGYYEWTDRWLNYPTTWAVIPDVITGTAEDQDALLAQWPHGDRGAPVWHMHEPIGRLLRLTDGFSKVCIGSSAEYATVLSPAWRRRMDEAWDALELVYKRTPWTHMLRGLQCVKHGWPFASVDSTDVARNHKTGKNRPDHMVDRWDRMQCPPARRMPPQLPTG